MNETIVIQVIMGQKIDSRILDLRSSIDREELRVVWGTSFILNKS